MHSSGVAQKPLGFIVDLRHGASEFSFSRGMIGGPEFFAEAFPPGIRLRIKLAGEALARSCSSTGKCAQIASPVRCRSVKIAAHSSGDFPIVLWASAIVVSFSDCAGGKHGTGSHGSASCNYMSPRLTRRGERWPRAGLLPALLPLREASMSAARRAKLAPRWCRRSSRCRSPRSRIARRR